MAESSMSSETGLSLEAERSAECPMTLPCDIFKQATEPVWAGGGIQGAGWFTPWLPGTLTSQPAARDWVPNWSPPEKRTKRAVQSSAFCRCCCSCKDARLYALPSSPHFCSQRLSFQRARQAEALPSPRSILVPAARSFSVSRLEQEAFADCQPPLCRQGSHFTPQEPKGPF